MSKMKKTRKPGGGRKKLKPEYDAGKNLKEQMDLLYHPGENLLLDRVTVQKQTMNLRVSSGSRVRKAVHQQVICGYIKNICNLDERFQARFSFSEFTVADMLVSNATAESKLLL